MKTKQKIKIGTKYKSSLSGFIMEVTDILKTYNSKGKIVDTFYHSKGINIPIINTHVCEIEILSNLIEENRNGNSR